jgi:predicted nucleic acid-binding Zn ribbon protein
MPVTGEDLIAFFGRYPPNGAPPEAARVEAAAMIKRALTAEKESEIAGLRAYREALDLDPTAKIAYEAIGRIVLAQSDLPKPALEAAIRYFEAAQKRLPGDHQLHDVVKKLRAIYAPGSNLEPALAKQAKAPSAPRTPSPSASSRIAGGPQRTCQYCGSPIPVNSPECRSCSLSGEIMKSDVRAAVRSRQKTSSRLILALLVAAVLVVVALGVAIYVRLHK